MCRFFKNYARCIKPRGQVDTSYMSALFNCEVTARFIDAQINNGERNMAHRD